MPTEFRGNGSYYSIYGVAPFVVNFIGETLLSPIAAWAWNFGDGSHGSGQFVQHTYTVPGSYDVTLTAVWVYGPNPPITKTEFVNVINPVTPITADFEADVTLGYTDLTVNFTDLSTGSPDTWSWDFGDGGTSSDQNPTHVYTTVGIYTVVLIASNSTSSDTNTKIDYIVVLQSTKIYLLQRTNRHVIKRLTNI